MLDYKKLYFQLFGRFADILEALEEGNDSKAREELIKAMTEAEEDFLSMEDKDQINS